PIQYPSRTPRLKNVLKSNAPVPLTPGTRAFMAADCVNAAPAKRSKKLSATASLGATARKTDSASAVTHIGLRIGRLLLLARALHPIGGGIILRPRVASIPDVHLHGG